MTPSGGGNAKPGAWCVASPGVPAALALLLTGMLAGTALAGETGAFSAAPASASAARSIKPAAVESGVAWAELPPAQKAFLEPLERNWSSLDAQQRRKWLELTTRVPKMSPDERARIQTRMTEWARLTPEQRGQARLNFQEAKQLPARDRQARWDAYQSLSPEEKKQLAARASIAASAPEAARKAALASARSDRPARDLPPPKSNIVPNPALAAPPKQIGPTLVQARPGATTTLISRPALPPSHQQTGMPKIAATPEFVNKSTLLPQRGPQGAATRSATAGPAASGAEATLRQ